MTNTTSTTITKIEDTGARVVRTILATGIPAFLTFAVVFPQVIAAAGLPISSGVYKWLIVAAGVITAVAAGITRILAIPAVNSILGKISAPTAQVTTVTPVKAITVAKAPAVSAPAPVVDAPIASAVPASTGDAPVASDVTPVAPADSSDAAPTA